MGLLGWVSISNMQNINGKTTEITERWLPSVQSINRISYLTENISSLEYKYIIESDPAKLANIENKLNNTIQEIDKVVKEYEAVISTEDEKKKFSILKDKLVKYQNLHKKFFELGSDVNIVQGTGNVNGIRIISTIGEADNMYTSIQVSLKELVDYNNKNAQQASKEADNVYKSSFILIISFLAGAIILGLSIAFFASRTISRPLAIVTRNVKRVAKGDLTMDIIRLKNKDEIGELALAFNEMGTSLANLIRQVRHSSETVAASSEELLASSEQTSRATEQIASAIQEVANGSEIQVNGAMSANQAMQEISNGMEQVATSIQTVNDLSVHTNQKAQTGNIVVSETVSQMGIVQEQVQQIASIIHTLGSRSKEIGNIVDLISRVSEQTNLLALNAAIEAARAGEHGRGFAVVADEVRKLAEESNKATDNIRDLIVQIQKEIEQVTLSMDEGTNSVKSGIEKVNQTGRSFQEITELISNITFQAQEVSATVEEVNASTEEMVQKMSDIASISQQSAGNSQQVAASAEEQNASMEEITASANALSSMAQELQSNIARFTV